MLGVVILITLVASFLSWHASLILKRNLYVTGHSYCYSLGMVKMEAFDDSHLCTRLLELVTLITLVPSFFPWHASLILKRNFYVTGH